MFATLPRWFLAGCVIAIPYTFLANGNFKDFFITAWIVPVEVSFLFLVYAMWGINRRDGKRPKWGNNVFWTTVTYFCLPVLLNGVSLVLKWAEYEAIGRYVFEIRYISLLAVPILLLLCGIIAVGVTNLRQRFIGGAT